MPVVLLKFGRESSFKISGLQQYHVNDATCQDQDRIKRVPWPKLTILFGMIIKNYFNVPRQVTNKEKCHGARKVLNKDSGRTDQNFHEFYL